jgi:hypothetical protein
MRRLIPLIAAAAALGAAVPAMSETADTKVNRHQEEVGFIVKATGNRYQVEDVNYGVQAEVKSQGKRRFNFYNREGTLFAYVRKGSGVRWDVFDAHHSSESIGHVDRVGRNHFAAYDDDGDNIGDATGRAAVQGAASVLVVFD